MSLQNYNTEKEIIKNIAIKNGYKPNVVDKMIQKIRNKKNQQPELNNLEPTEFICVPYSTILNKPMRKTFNCTNLKLSYRTRSNSFGLIQKFSTTRRIQNENEPYKKLGIYKLKCKECPKFYIWQTGRNFSCRYKEHIQAIKSGNQANQKSMFADHILERNHSCGKLEETIEILNFEKKGEKMNVKEEL
jgi:hypothetical protein